MGHAARPKFGKEPSALRLCSRPSSQQSFARRSFLLLRWAGRLRLALPREGGGGSFPAAGQPLRESQHGGRLRTLPFACFAAGRRAKQRTSGGLGVAAAAGAGAMGERLRGQAGVSSAAAAPTCSLHNGLPLHNGFHPLAGNGEASHPLHFRPELPLSSHDSPTKKSRARRRMDSGRKNRPRK